MARFSVPIAVQTQLLERSSQLAALQEALGSLAGGGRIVLLSGEAGIGKTTLVQHFAGSLAESAMVLQGACDALFTPHPLGPFYDIAMQIQPDLLPLLSAGCDWRSIAPTVLAWLHGPRQPVVVIVEDVHWADEATLDLLKFVGRRIQHYPALLILTFRDDALGAQHPLRLLLGDLPAAHTTRIAVPSFSHAAVAMLAGGDERLAADLYAITGGNPFFVTELLASQEAQVPATVRDAVLARVARLDAGARDVLELASVVPGAVERWVVTLALQPATDAIDACLERGLLRLDTRGLAFRHELARRAVEQALPPARAQALHSRVLRVLVDHAADGVTMARLVHHAMRAGDGEAVAGFAPRAAQQASASGAHREAAALYSAALAAGSAMPPETQARLLEACSYELYLTGRLADAIGQREQALAIWQALGTTLLQGDTLRWLSRLHWFSGHSAEALHYADAAITVLEHGLPSEALAMAYSNRSQLAMLAEQAEQAQYWGRRALAVAEPLGASETQVHALTNLGTASLQRGDLAGQTQLEEALALALQHEWHDHAGRVYANLSTLAVQRRAYGDAARYLEAGLAYTALHDLDAYHGYLLGWRARLHFDQGDWDTAESDAQAALQLHSGASVTPIPAMITLGHVRARRGQPDQALLDQARDLALPTGEFQRIGPLAAARAEAAWWAGDPGQVVAEAEAAYELAQRALEPWMRGQLAYWLWRAGRLAAMPDNIPGVFRAMLCGEWQAAAAEWQRIGAPFERALALVGGDEAAQREALAIFEQLGARPAAAALRRTLRERGIQRIPRGPRPATRDNPLGLTRRESEVLALLAEGLTNAEIGQRLSITPKTADHHVAAILSKLGAHTRGEAVMIARHQQFLP